jgi:hypothetical protein
VAPSHPDIDVILPLAIGAAMTCVTILIHALAVGTIVRFVRRERRLGYAGVNFWEDVSIVAGVTLLALAAHFVEILMWAVVLELCAEFPNFATAFYASAANYTTLGYPVMSATWRLLGPLEAADAMLMFAVSTGMIFSVIQKLRQTRLDYLDA